MNVYCGIDWAEGHHDIAVVDTEGKLLASRRIGDDLAGLNKLCTILTEHSHPDQTPVPVAIETPRGLFVSSLRDRGFPVYAINPLSAARYRRPATETAIPSHGRNQTPKTPQYWPISCAQTVTRTAAWLRIPSLSEPSRSWQERSKTPSGKGKTSATRSAHCCVNTIQLR